MKVIPAIGRVTDGTGGDPFQVVHVGGFFVHVGRAFYMRKEGWIKVLWRTGWFNVKLISTILVHVRAGIVQLGRALYNRVLGGIEAW